jgi:hypothetical protein
VLAQHLVGLVQLLARVAHRLREIVDNPTGQLKLTARRFQRAARFVEPCFTLLGKWVGSTGPRDILAVIGHATACCRMSMYGMHLTRMQAGKKQKRSR